MNVDFVTALFAGMLSFLSPCVLPLVPAYLCYMAGVSVEDFRQETGQSASRVKLLKASFLFVLGFSTVFVALGAGASSVGQFLRSWQNEIAVIAGVLIIAMGLNFLGVFKIAIFSREARFQPKASGPLAAYIMGLAFAFGWTPCIGPVLGPILTIAGGRETVGEGALLLAVYSLGLGLPFILAAFFSGAFMGLMGRFRSRLGQIEKVIGVLLVLAGIFFISGGIQSAAFWLLETFPLLGTLG